MRKHAFLSPVGVYDYVFCMLSQMLVNEHIPVNTKHLYNIHTMLDTYLETRTTKCFSLHNFFILKVAL